jgi:hypothetical protein
MSLVAPVRRFDTAKGHYYKDAAGTRVTGVTTLIDKGLPKPALINWAGNATAEYAVDHWDELAALGPAARLKKLQGARYEAKDAAAKRGTDVHTAAEGLLRGESVQVPDEIAGHVESYARFLDEFKVEALHVEFGLVSYRWEYAGTGDLYASLTLPQRGRCKLLLDLKTNRTGVFGDIALQLAGYRYADKWIVDGTEVDVPPIEYCGAVHVRSDGYDLIPVEVTEIEHRALLYAARVGKFEEGSRDLLGPPVMPATTSTFRLVRAAVDNVIANQQEGTL